MIYLPKELPDVTLVEFLLARTTEQEAPDDLPHHPYCSAVQEADDGGCEFRGGVLPTGHPHGG